MFHVQILNSKTKQLNRQRRHSRVRALVRGTAEWPRVSVFKSNRHVFVQFVDDEVNKTILSSKVISTKKSKIKENKTEKALKVGEMLGAKAQELGITKAVFDRGGFKYHGRIKAVAEGLRKSGIKI